MILKEIWHYIMKYDVNIWLNYRRKFAVPAYTTIPESGEQGGSSGQHKPAFQSGSTLQGSINMLLLD